MTTKRPLGHHPRAAMVGGALQELTDLELDVGNERCRVLNLDAKAMIDVYGLAQSWSASFEWFRSWTELTDWLRELLDEEGEELEIVLTHARISNLEFESLPEFEV